MKVIIQRVAQASVSVEGKPLAAIDQGLLLLVGFGPDDQEEDLDYIVRKVVNMRLFSDSQGKLNRSIRDIRGQILSISQFTLYADTKKGNRPSFTGAAKAEAAKNLYRTFNLALSAYVPVSQGEFGADMQVKLINDGPVTITLDSKHR